MFEFPESKIHSITELTDVNSIDDKIDLNLKRRNNGKHWKYDETSSAITKKNG